VSPTQGPTWGGFDTLTTPDVQTSAIEGCDCPKFITDAIAGRTIVVSDGAGFVKLPECCTNKLTPGITCKKLNTCQSCSLVDFCRWSDQNGFEGCQYQSDLEPGGDSGFTKCGSSGTRASEYVQDFSEPLPKASFPGSLTEEPIIVRDNEVRQACVRCENPVFEFQPIGQRSGDWFNSVFPSEGELEL